MTPHPGSTVSLLTSSKIGSISLCPLFIPESRIEIKLIDTTVDSLAHFINKLGVKARPIQTGNLSSSLRLMAVGLILGLVFALVLSVL